jgi:hypothetical protein
MPVCAFLGRPFPGRPDRLLAEVIDTGCIPEEKLAQIDPFSPHFSNPPAKAPAWPDRHQKDRRTHGGSLISAIVKRGWRPRHLFKVWGHG